ncbi:hypothetical protein IE994_23885 [Enterobacter hormaechei]|nr:hypothetical protein [Enterobacter hormaechei]MBD3717537.1 hypothetical protein [Enterobacter hormaechei]
MSEHLFRTNRLHSLYEALVHHASSPQAAFVTLLGRRLNGVQYDVGYHQSDRG